METKERLRFALAIGMIMVLGLFIGMDIVGYRHDEEFAADINEIIATSTATTTTLSR